MLKEGINLDSLQIHRSLSRSYAKEQGKWFLSCPSCMANLRRGMRSKNTTNNNKEGGGFCDFLAEMHIFCIQK